MNLTEKDHDFLTRVKPLLDDGSLRVRTLPGRLQLCGNYGHHIHQHFGMSRQGVRWRFQRVIAMYRHAFVTILTVENLLGPQLREAVISQVRRSSDEASNPRTMGSDRRESSGGDTPEDHDQG